MKNIRTSHASEPASADVRYRANPPHRILLVENDAGVCRSSAQVLIISGYKVDAAADGSIAWEALHNHHYDLLITNNNIPQGSDVDLLEKMRVARMTVPVIMAAESLPEVQLARYPRLQPVATLPKPFTSVQLLGTVKKVLRAADSTREQSESLPIWRRAFSRWFKAPRIQIPGIESD